MNILLVEHDPVTAHDISHHLARHGMGVDVAPTGREAASKLQRHGADAVAIVDVALPDIDGFEVLRKLRAGGLTLPVILLTGPDAVEDRVYGLELGADDCLAKPFAAAELVARLRALERRIGREQLELRLGGLTLDVSARLARGHGKLIKLLPREWDILAYLMRNAARLVSKESIMAAISTADDALTATAVIVNISRLRRKIAGAGVRIRVFRGKGYLLECGPV